MNMKRLSIVFVTFAVAFGATGADLSYTPQGSAPYYWSDTAAWGGAVPTSVDNVKVNSSTLLGSPLVVPSETSATGAKVLLGDGVLQVENGANLAMGSEWLILADKNLTGVVTNYGTATIYKLDLGVYGDAGIGMYKDAGGSGAGRLAQFDNFGNLTIGSHLRLQVNGTPSLFYNHAGATVNKTGGTRYSFYFGVGGNSANKLCRIINEGDFFDNTDEIWMGLTGKSHSENEIIVQGNGRFFSEKRVALGMNGGSRGSIILNDNGYLSGNAAWFVGGSDLDDRYKGAEGRIILNDSSVFSASNHVCLGRREACIGTILLNDSSKMTTTSYMSFGYEKSATGSMTMGGNSSLANASVIYLGYGQDSTGSLTLTNSATAVVDGKVYMCYSVGATGNLTLADSATVNFRKDVHVGFAGDSVANVALTNSAVLDINGEVFVGENAGTLATISLAGDSRLYVTNLDMLVGYNGGATGVLNIAENAQVHVPSMGIGQTDKPGTTGFVKLSDTATLFSTNITIPRWGGQGWGTLEVGGNSVVTNVHILRVAYHQTQTSGVGQSGTVAMRGGSMFFDIDPANSNYVATGYYNPIALNGYITTARGRIRGYGKIAFSDPRKYVTEAEVPSGMVHYGQVIADGEGEMHDLDFGRFGAMNYGNTAANPSGTNGWFAVNKGRLKLPRSLPRKAAGYRCVGDYWALDYSSGTSWSNRLANTFTTVFTGAALNNFIFAELYATDRDDIPAGLDGIGADKVISVWRAGLFDDGPEADEPTHPSSFTSAKVHFKYPNVGDDLDGMARVCVYRHDGTVSGKWQLVGRAKPSTRLPVVGATVSAPSTENWNMGWFAIVAREKPFGTTLSIR